MKTLARYFLKGLIFLVPIVVTIYVIYIFIAKVDSIFKFDTPGLGLIVTVLSITVMGFIASNFLTRRLISLVDSIFTSTPLIKMIYTALKDLLNVFVGERKVFKPVLVTLMPGSNVRLIGFVTRESMANIGLAEHVAVYLPQSYNYAGNLLVVPKDQVAPLNVETSDIMAFDVSGGITAK